MDDILYKFIEVSKQLSEKQFEWNKLYNSIKIEEYEYDVSNYIAKIIKTVPYLKVKENGEIKNFIPQKVYGSILADDRGFPFEGDIEIISDEIFQEIYNLKDKD